MRMTVRREEWGEEKKRFWVVRDPKGRILAKTAVKGSGIESIKEARSIFEERGTYVQNKDILKKELLGSAKTKDSPSRKAPWSKTAQGHNVYKYVTSAKNNIPKGKQKHFQIKVVGKVHFINNVITPKTLTGYSYKDVSKKKGIEQAKGQIKKKLSKTNPHLYESIERIEIIQVSWIGYVVR